MIVRVKLFAAARELAGCDELSIEVETPATIGDVRREVTRTCPMLATILPHCLWALDARYANDGDEVSESSEVALIPPVSGG
jgi:molybdopterin converting factor subunit 1